MRDVGDRAPGGAAGRHNRISGQEPPLRDDGASLFVPAYQAAQPPAPGGPGDPGQPGGYGAGEYGPDEYRPGQYAAAEAAPGVLRAIRGFAPLPGDLLPVYPPGPFEAWNASPAAGVSRRPDLRSQPGAGGGGGWTRQAAATITPDEFDTNHSMPAIKDPILGGASRRPAAPGRGASPGSGTAARGLPGRGLAARGGAVRAGSEAGVPGRGLAERGSRGLAERAGTGWIGDDRPGRDRADGGQRSRMAGGHGGRGRGGDPGRPGTHARQQPIRLAIGAAVAIVVAVAVILITTGGGGPNQAAAKPSNSVSATPTPTPAPTPTPPPGPWAFIGTRKSDPTPLTNPELYPVSVYSGPTLYLRLAAQASKDCVGALVGSDLQSAASAGSCSQVERATYLAGPLKMMGTIGVLNLTSYAAAAAAGKKAGQYEFISRLPAKTGPTHSIGGGTGLEEAVAKGHYLILVWAQYTNLTAGKTKALQQQLKLFMDTLISQTANVSLSVRMVDGQPSPSASASLPG